MKIGTVKKNQRMLNYSDLYRGFTKHRSDQNFIRPKRTRQSFVRR